MAEPVHSVDSARISAHFEARVPSSPPPRAAWKLLLPIAVLVMVAVVVLLLLGSH
ncbi:MAG TPA: hypothetical protein VIW29_16605 [Polyangiaceae bacterium]